MEENNQPPADGPNTPPVESLPTEQIPATTPTKPKSKLPVLIATVVLIISVVVGSFFILNWYIRMQELGGSTACTMEAKICPDGTSVGRTGPNCEFSPCPSSTISPTPDPTTNWKTYIGNGFTYKYPDNWSHEENKQPNSTNNYNILTVYLGELQTINHIGETVTPYVGRFVTFTVAKHDDLTNKSVAEYKDIGNDLKPRWATKEFGGQKWIVVQHLGCQSGQCIEALIKNRDTFYSFFHQNPGNFGEEFGQILSTFTFASPD